MTQVVVEPVEGCPSKEDHDRILALLNADNRRRSDIVDLDDIAVFLRQAETREIVGGLWAEDDFAWVFVKYLVVPEGYRGHGIGTRLMAEAERMAQARGRVGIWLNTFDFQARGFYEKIGFEVFGRLEGTTPANGQTFLRKHFPPQSQDIDRD